MKDIVGSLGTRGSLALRVSQIICVASSLVVMSFSYGPSNYRAFGYLVVQMELQLFWSFILACIDIHSLRTNWDLHITGNLWKYVIGDWIMTILSLAAASSSVAVVIFLTADVEFCRVHPYVSCSWYKVSVILASMAWSFTAASAGSTFWLLVALYGSA